MRVWKMLGQILDQFAEVHPAVGGEVEHDLGTVKGVLGLHQFHFQAVAGNALLAGVVGAFLILAVLAHPAHIHAVGHPGDGLERLGNGAVGDLFHALHHLTALNAAGGLHNHVFAGFDVGPGRVEIIAFAVFLETDRDDFFSYCSSQGKLPYLVKRPTEGPENPF